MKVRSSRYFTRSVTRAAGLSGTNSDKIDLPPEYNTITGVAVFIKNITNQPNFKLGFGDEGGTLLNPTHHNILKSGDSVSPDCKFLSVNFPYSANGQFKALVEHADGAVAGNPLEFDIVFKLADIDWSAKGAPKKALDENINYGNEIDNFEAAPSQY